MRFKSDSLQEHDPKSSEEGWREEERTPTMRQRFAATSRTNFPPAETCRVSRSVMVAQSSLHQGGPSSEALLRPEEWYLKKETRDPSRCTSCVSKHAGRLTVSKSHQGLVREIIFKNTSSNTSYETEVAPFFLSCPTGVGNNSTHRTGFASLSLVNACGANGESSGTVKCDLCKTTRSSKSDRCGSLLHDLEMMAQPRLPNYKHCARHPNVESTARRSQVSSTTTNHRSKQCTNWSPSRRTCSHSQLREQRNNPQTVDPQDGRQRCQRRKHASTSHPHSEDAQDIHCCATRGKSPHFHLDWWRPSPADSRMIFPSGVRHGIVPWTKNHTALAARPK